MRRNYKLGPKGVINLVTIFFFGLCVCEVKNFYTYIVGDSSNFSKKKRTKKLWLYIGDIWNDS